MPNKYSPFFRFLALIPFFFPFSSLFFPFSSFSSFYQPLSSLLTLAVPPEALFEELDLLHHSSQEGGKADLFPLGLEEGKTDPHPAQSPGKVAHLEGTPVPSILNVATLSGLQIQF